MDGGEGNMNEGGLSVVKGYEVWRYWEAFETVMSQITDDAVQQWKRFVQ